MTLKNNYPEEKLLIHEKFSENKKRLVATYQIGIKTYDDIDVIEASEDTAKKLFLIRAIELGVPVVIDQDIKQISRKEADVQAKIKRTL